MLTSALVTDIQRRASVPMAQNTFSQADFYQMIDREIESKMVPLILRCMSEYMVADYPYNITANQAFYAIPPRAIAGKLRDVQIISSSNPDAIYPLEKLDVTELYSSSSTTFRVLIQKQGFYIEGNYVRVYPTPQQTNNILNPAYSVFRNHLADYVNCCANLWRDQEKASR